MIPHSRPTLGEEEKRACLEVLDSLQIAQGKQVKKLEEIFCRFTGRGHAIAVNSGTSALQLALAALGISEGEEVMIPSFDCAALLHALEPVRAKAVVTDMDPEDFNISAEAIKKKIHKKTKAVIVPHLFGRAARIKEIMRLGIPVIEDGTQALGASASGKKVGSFGEISLFSFYATKMITTGEGGILLTDSASLAEKLRDMRDYDKKEKYRPRTNSKMTDFQAAIGVEQMKKLPQFIERRRQIAGRYDEALQETGLKPPAEDSERPHVYYRYVVRIPKKSKSWISNLQEQGIDAKNPIFKPLHQYLNLSNGAFPETFQAWKECVSIPIYPSLTDEECEKVCQGIYYSSSDRRESRRKALFSTSSNNISS